MLDAANARLTRDGRASSLPPRPLAQLTLLTRRARHPGELVTKDGLSTPGGAIAMSASGRSRAPSTRCAKFVQRVCAHDPAFVLTAANRRAVCELCAPLAA